MDFLAPDPGSDAGLLCSFRSCGFDHDDYDNFDHENDNHDDYNDDNFDYSHDGDDNEEFKWHLGVKG